MKNLLAVLLATLALTAQAQVTGAGATFPAPVYSKWADAYNKETGTTINYAAIGSGGGINQIKAKTVDFGGTDDPMTAAQLRELGLLQFPTVIGGVVPVVNLRGVEAGKLVLDGPTLAEIYNGKITKWNDKLIAILNPKIALPDQEITVVVRADSSGTTAVFTDYLSQVSPGFKADTGAGKSPNWRPKNVTAGKGNAGVAAFVQQLPGAIGYVEYAFAKQSKLIYTAMKDSKGKIILPDDTTFAEAAKAAKWTVPGMAANLNNVAGWPITAATFVLIYEKSDKSRAVVKFYDWVFTRGDALATELDYVPLPKAVKDHVRADWKKAGLI